MHSADRTRTLENSTQNALGSSSLTLVFSSRDGMSVVGQLWVGDGGGGGTRKNDPQELQVREKLKANVS